MKKRTRRSIGSVILAATLIVSMFFGCFTQKKIVQPKIIRTVLCAMG